ncbi:MAG: urease accessory protein UreD [Opitutales bacterium]
MSGLSGHLLLRAEAREGGRTVLAGQSGRSPYHVSKPYWDEAAGTLIVQVVNATAGILAGDRLESEIRVEAGAALLVTAPSASRIFRMGEGAPAECRQRFTVATGGWMEVLPEPLVPHRGCRYRQTTRLEVAAGAGLFFADLVLPGRTAHGETWAWDRLCLETEVRVAGELVLRERFDQTGPGLKSLADWAGSGATACFGNALLLVPEGEGTTQSRPSGIEVERVDPNALGLARSQSSALGSMRSTSEALTAALARVSALHGNGVWLGVSPLRRGGWSIKFVAPDSQRLRETLRAIRRELAAVWPQLSADSRKL